MQNLREALGMTNTRRHKKSKLSEADYITLTSKRADDEGLDLEYQGHKVTGLGFDPANRVWAGKSGECKRDKEAIKIEGDNSVDKKDKHRKHKKSKKHKHKRKYND